MPGLCPSAIPLLLCHAKAQSQLDTFIALPCQGLVAARYLYGVASQGLYPSSLPLWPCLAGIISWCNITMLARPTREVVTLGLQPLGFSVQVSGF